MSLLLFCAMLGAALPDAKPRSELFSFLDLRKIEAI